MAKVKRDEDREERISMEIVVDAYGAEEQAMGWYYYITWKSRFNFRLPPSALRSVPYHLCR